MLSPISLSICCTLLICLPFALFFSTNTTKFPIPTLSSFSNSTTSNSTKTPSANRSPITENKIKLPIPTSSSSLSSSSSEEEEEEDDDALFHRASLTSPNPTLPKKIAFMFLTTTPLPFTPLWHLFFQTPKPQNLFNIYIHADPSLPYNPPFSGLFSNRTIPSKPTRRSDPSLISAARRLLARALLDDSSNAMFALLSPSCIPLHSFSFIYKTLTNSSTKSFIEILSKEPTLWSRYGARGPGAMMPEIPFRSFRVGSQFFVLTRSHARVVVGDTRLWGKFKLPCKRVDRCYPEEHYFPTLLSMVGGGSRTFVPATLTHVDWRGSKGGHPRTYGSGDIGPDLIRGLRTAKPRYGDEGAGNGSRSEEYPFLFARKFSPECLEPLMRIAGDVIFRD